MGCKCQEKNVENSTIPCPDPTEESFRQAFLRETHKSSRLAGEREDALLRLKDWEDRARRQMEALEMVLRSTEKYAAAAVAAMPDDLKKAFTQIYGEPPQTLKISS